MSKLSSLASVSATRMVLERYGLATKKALGQHFLINDGIVSRICETAELGCDDFVLEVGPGIGTLTLGLLQKARGVIAVERDKDLPLVLSDTCAEYADHLVVINKDALELSTDEVCEAISALGVTSPVEVSKATENIRIFPKKLVSNLPYAVAATIILDFFERFDELETATVMVQSEVADRICAQPGTKAYGAYTVKLSLFTQVVSRFSVGPKNFFPPPRVTSAVVHLERIALRDREGNPVEARVRRAACIMADAAFANRRKTLSNSCKTYFNLLGERGELIRAHLPALFARAHIDPQVRGETLGYQDFIILGEVMDEICRENQIEQAEEDQL